MNVCKAAVGSLHVNVLRESVRSGSHVYFVPIVSTCLCVSAPRLSHVAALVVPMPGTEGPCSGRGCG
jgi:hypothetical protein